MEEDFMYQDMLNQANNNYYFSDNTWSVIELIR